MTYSDRFCDALAYTTRLHAEQKRKVSGAPYLSHLLRVTGIAIGHGADEDEAIAALLHDAVEDQGGTPTLLAIRERFGTRVAEIVDGCTDADGHPKPPWRRRKEIYLARLRDASPSVRLVAACDKLDNARSVLSNYLQRGESIWDRFRGGRDGTLWYLQSVVHVLDQSDCGSLVDELRRVVRQIEHAVDGPHDSAVAKNSP